MEATNTVFCVKRKSELQLHNFKALRLIMKLYNLGLYAIHSQSYITEMLLVHFWYKHIIVAAAVGLECGYFLMLNYFSLRDSDGLKKKY